jgi:hypothetical protein
MSLVLEPPIWYARDEMYVSNVKETDLFVVSDPIDLSIKGHTVATTPDINDELKTALAELISTGTSSWFSAPVKAASILKRLKFEFIPFDHEAESKWVKIQWVPKHLQIKSKGVFTILFIVSGFLDSNPRIPSSFLGSMTPRATTPTEEIENVAPVSAVATATAVAQTQNTVMYPTEPDGLELVTNLALSDSQGDSIELRSARQMSEKQRLRQAKLRSAIARLKVEELRENYLRRYGDADYSEDEGSSDESLDSEDLP